MSRRRHDHPHRIGMLAIRSAWLAIAALMAVACSREPVIPRKTQLARLPEHVTEIVISDDAGRLAYVDFDFDAKEMWVVHDGVQDERYIGAGGLAFSPVTRKLFYGAQSQESGFLVADGKKIGGFGREGTLVFSTDGTRWATAAGAAKETGDDANAAPLVVVFADGKEIGRHRDASVPTFSPDGRHLAYLAGTEDGTKLIVDGNERATYPAASGACTAARKGRPQGPNFWPQFQTKYLSDGTIVLMTQDENGWGIYRDKARMASYETSTVQKSPTPSDDCATLTAVAAWSLTTAEKAPVAVWWERLAGDKEQWRVVRNGKPADEIICSKPWVIQPPELSSDGHIAYACQETDPVARIFLVKDGQRYGPYVEMWAYVWSDDGAHVAYAASEGAPERPWRYYVDGEPRTDGFDGAWRPRFEPGTGRLMWEGKVEGEDRGILGIDRRQVGSFDALVWGPKILHPGIVTWVIRRGERLVRLDLPTGPRSR